MATLEVLSLESLPIGFRFRPTDVMLINDYLKRKINGQIKADIPVIAEVDVCRCEPWDLPEKSLIKSKDHEWFFFAPKNRKYRNSPRANRATQYGYWKSTGKDRVIMTPAPSPVHIGMKKTLVFHRGRAPRGKRTRWIIHEYCTVEADFQQGGFVLCRLFKKADDKKPTSNPEEMDSSGFSASLTRPSPDTTVHVDDSLDEPQESVPCNLDEIVDMMEKSVETHSYSDATTDVGASGIDKYNMKDYPVPSKSCNLNPESEPHGSDVFYCNSPLDYYLNHLSFDDNGGGVPAKDEVGDSEFVAEFLNSILVNNEDESPLEFNNYLENPSEAVPASQVCHSENLAVDELQCNFLTAKDMFESSDNDPNNLFGVSDLSHDLSKNEPDPSNSDNTAGIKIKIRPRRPQISANLNQQGHQAMAVHGTAVKRIRLQTSLHQRSTVIADGKSNGANGGHDEKAEISESGKKMEFEAPTSNKVAEIAYSGSSDNDDNSQAPNPSRRLRPKDLNDLCVKPEDPSLPEAPKAATVCSGRVTVVIPVILSILCIGIGWFFSSR